ncbi:MAG TPA: hypothetical protein VN437_01320 [Rectinemataceae bacterium]|nr:hypothetical protein [Rectinemataceae bacterium]
MSGIKRFHKLLVLLLLILPSAIQSQTVSSPALCFDMSIRVPVILKISVDHSWNTTLRLSGIYGSAGIYTNQSSGQRFFEIRKAARVDLGAANLFSNVSGKYCIVAASQNGGKLGHDAGNADRAIPYSLLVNGTAVASSNGLFEYQTFGKSTGSGTLFDVGIELGEIPEGLPEGIYSDRLVFSVEMR